jgi:hypothetical protein
MVRVGQNHIYTVYAYMTVYLVISLPKIPYIHRICMVLANPIYGVYIAYMLLFWQQCFFYRVSGHIRRTCTVMANPRVKMDSYKSEQ